VFFLILTALPCLPAFAQNTEEQTLKVTDPEDTSAIYAPDTCDFEVAFPEEPYISKRCPEGRQSCYDLTTYTMVFDFSTTVDVSVSCNPSSPENFQNYGEDVMRAALRGMVARNMVDDYEIRYQDRGEIRQATLSGTGNKGRQSKIYTAQIWAGQNSVMTIEGELIGPMHPEADRTFSDILKSVQKKRELPEEPEEEND